MKKVSMLEFRRNAARVLRLLKTEKETVRLTYRGEALADLVPVQKQTPSRPPESDPFYRLPDLAVHAKPLSNDEIDGLLYGQS